MEVEIEGGDADRDRMRKGKKKGSERTKRERKGRREKRRRKRRGWFGLGLCSPFIRVSAERSGSFNEPCAPLHMLTRRKIRSIYLQPWQPAEGSARSACQHAPRSPRAHRLTHPIPLPSSTALRSPLHRYRPMLLAHPSLQSSLERTEVRRLSDTVNGVM